MTNPIKGSISGLKFEDINGNRIKDAGERGLADWTIFIDEDKDEILDPCEVHTTTDAHGNYTFTGLAPGDYTIREVPQINWIQTTINPADINIKKGTIVDNVDFGNRKTADLEISKEFIPTFKDVLKIATYGESISFELTAKNNGPFDAEDVVITDSFSQLENLTISGLPKGGSYTLDNDTNTLDISIPELAGGKEVTITVTGDVVVPEELVIFNFFGQLDNNNPELQEYASTVLRGTQWLDLNLTKEVGKSTVHFNFNSITNSATIDAGNIFDPDISNNTDSDTADIAHAKYEGTLGNEDPGEYFVVETASNDLPFIDVDWGVASDGGAGNNSEFLPPDEVGAFELNLFWDNAEAIEKGVPGGLFEQFLALEADGDLKDPTDEQAILDFLEARILAGDNNPDKFMASSLALSNNTGGNQGSGFSQGQSTPDLEQADVVTIVVRAGDSLQKALDNLDPAPNIPTVLKIVVESSVTKTRLQNLNFNSLLNKGYFVKELDIQGNSTTFASGKQAASIDLSLIEVTGNSLTLRGNKGDDSLTGSSLAETIKGNKGEDKIAGGLGDDSLFGGKGKDFLRGDAGDDLLNGGKGNDVLRGSFGLDILIGGKGKDIFVLEANAGLDTVRDYSKRDDIGLLGISESDLTLTVEGRDTIISLNGNDLMLVEDTAPKQISFTSNFSFI